MFAQWAEVTQMSKPMIAAIISREGDKILLAHSQRHPPKLSTVLAGFVEVGETLEKAVAGYTKDASKIDIFSAQDKVYSQQVNYGLSHHMAPSNLKMDTPEQAPGASATVDELLNVSSSVDQDFVSRSFGPKSRHH